MIPMAIPALIEAEMEALVAGGSKMVSAHDLRSSIQTRGTHFTAVSRSMVNAI
jgi:hypothetical protein